MKTITASIKRHPVLTYYALVFAISWGGILLIVGGPGGIPGSSEQVETMMPLVLMALFAGPSVARHPHDRPRVGIPRFLS